MARLFHQPQSIRRKLIISFSLIFILLIGLLGYITYHMFSKNLTAEVISYTSKIVTESKLNMDSYFNQIKTLIQITAGQSLIQDAVSGYEESSNQQGLIYHRQVEDRMKDILRYNPSIKDVMVIKPSGNVYEYSGGTVRKDYLFYSQNWFPKFQNDEFFRVHFIGVHPQDYYFNPPYESEKVISAVAPVFDFWNPSRRDGTSVVFNLELREIQELTKESKLEQHGYFLIMDQSNQIVFKPSEVNLSSYLQANITQNMDKVEGRFQVGKGDDTFLGVYTTSKVTGWKIIAMIPMKEILAHNDNINKLILLLLGAAILSVILISIVVSSRITYPIIRLMRKMSDVKQGNFEVDLYDNSSVEMQKLTTRIMQMIKRINELNYDVYAFAMKTKEAEISALQSQINPHFLYNTLQSIKSLAICERNEDVSSMVTLLGDVMRYSIYHPNEMVVLYKEVEHVKAYLQIQNYRYPDKIHFELVVIGQILHMKMPKLLLQPIVENAVIHGFSGNRKGNIIMSIQPGMSGLEITIEDTGQGMDEKKLTTLRELLRQEDVENREHIGVKNVHDRIRYKFGEAYGLIIESKVEQGTKVIIQIPQLGDEHA
ncbi:two-component system sensor histidine kinase YesM [Paenibacillus shirakamiensis]|uniref:Two-component system sensor histidine kinase YesM n=1 Tax=Paenibacillus shirakamiensis TaxID=1265935 RepID=A0ABS4JEM2_9BACL|nr:sensor histidine kinase [Paenibacillus shirakamiensis]MBP2000164.1 two-component system sensor histidine kinase YesM [Paenibacillus shirakamiensis]